VRRPLIAFGVIALLLGGVAVAYVAGVGPLARPTAAGSVVFVAISRSTDEADAREIEAIDLTAGTRDLFDAGGRITAMALSPDRRSLYVGLDGGKIVLMDATTGSQFGAVDLGAVAVTNIQSTVVAIDLATKKTADPIVFPLPAGVAVISGDALVVPLGDAQRLQVAFIDVRTREVTSRLTLPRGSLVAPVAFTIGDAAVGLAAYDPGFGGGAGLRIYRVTDPLHWTDLTLQAPSPFRIGVGLQAAASRAGVVHVCTIAGTAARRYVISPDLKGSSAGTECGPLAGGDQIVMARRDPARLLVLDNGTGTISRTLPLAGVPARLVH
jgi:hypothetical protein